MAEATLESFRAAGIRGFVCRVLMTAREAYSVPRACARVEDEAVEAGRASLSGSRGRPSCAGERFMMVELLFLPSVPARPARPATAACYNPETLVVEWRGRTIAEVLPMTVDAACGFFADEPQVLRLLTVLRKIGRGYLRLGQPATELSGGEAQRIKLATELQRAQRGQTLYVLDEPTSGLHPPTPTAFSAHGSR